MSLHGRSHHQAVSQVVWDGLGLDSGHSGIGYYGKCLYEALSDLGESPLVTSLVGARTVIDPRHILLVPGSSQFDTNGKTQPNRIYSLKPIFPSLSYKTAARQFPALIYHGLSNLNLPCFVKRRPADKFIVTIHDIIPLLTGGPSALSLQMRVLMPRVVQIADAIIVPSNWTKTCLIERFGRGIEQKINVIPNGTIDITREFPPNKPMQKTNDVISVARGETYKRIELISSLAKARPQTRFILVTDALGVRRVGDGSPNLNVVTNVSRQDLVNAYSSSRIFLHPSLYEGWCLPAADAIKAGLFTIYVNGTGLDDVCAYAPDRCHGLNADACFEDWLEALTQALEHGSGHEDVRHIPLPTWNSNAEKTLKIYQSLL